MDPSPHSDRSVPTEKQAANSLARPTMVLQRAIRNAGHLIGGSILLLTAAILFICAYFLSIDYDPAGFVALWIALPIALLGLYATISGMTY